MPSLNKCFLIGNVTRDVELRYTRKGMAVSELGLAVNRVWTDENGQKQEETTWISVTLWARLAEIASQYLRKGSPVFIEGRLHLDSWLNQAGQKQTKLRVIAENMQLLGSREPAASPGQKEHSAPSPPRPAAPSAPSRPTPAPASASAHHPPPDPDLDMEPDDIPF